MTLSTHTTSFVANVPFDVYMPCQGHLWAVVVVAVVVMYLISVLKSGFVRTKWVSSLFTDQVIYAVQFSSVEANRGKCPLSVKVIIIIQTIIVRPSSLIPVSHTYMYVLLLHHCQVPYSFLRLTRTVLTCTYTFTFISNTNWTNCSSV